jgi:putative membrane protein
MQPGEMMWYGMIFGPVIMIIWLVVLVLVAAAVIRWLQGGASPSLPFAGGRKRALEILEERFAKGEIDKDEFQEKKCLLSD